MKHLNKINQMEKFRLLSVKERVKNSAQSASELKKFLINLNF